MGAKIFFMQDVFQRYVVPKVGLVGFGMLRRCCSAWSRLLPAAELLDWLRACVVLTLEHRVETTAPSVRPQMVHSNAVRNGTNLSVSWGEGVDPVAGPVHPSLVPNAMLKASETLNVPMYRWRPDATLRLSDYEHLGRNVLLTAFTRFETLPHGSIHDACRYLNEGCQEAPVLVYPEQQCSYWVLLLPTHAVRGRMATPEW